MPATPFDVLAEELGAVAARVERESALRIEAAVADLRRIDAERELRLTQLERRIEDALSRVKDGAQGPAGRDGVDGKDGAAGRDGLDGAQGERGLIGEKGEAGAPGRDGIDGAAGRDGAAGAVGERGGPGAAGRDGIDGKDGVPGERGPQGERGDPGPAPTAEDIDGAVARYLLANPVPAGPAGERGPAGEKGEQGAAGERGSAPSADEIAVVVTSYFASNPIPAGAAGEKGPAGEKGERGDPGEAGRDGVDGQPGRDGVDGAAGPRGESGAPGKLPLVKAWVDRVYYEGEAATSGGATYQALRDTGRAPPHDDWQCIAAAGRDGKDGRSPIVERTFDPDREDYSALAIVALNGASFIARRDNPGPCPGDGWQMIAAQGKRGNAGDPGKTGPKGDRGEPGVPLVAAVVDDAGLLVLTNGDGTTAECDLYPILTKLAQ